MPSLFRPEALSAQKIDWAGKVVIVTPISFVFLTFCAFMAGLVLIIFLVWGEYTKRSTVKGQLIPDKGLVQVYTTTAGVIIEKYVSEGQAVKAGDMLYKISTTRHTDAGNVQSIIDKELAFKRQLIEHEISRTKQAQAAEKRNIANTIERLQVDMDKLQAQIDLQAHQVAIAKKTLARYEFAMQSEAVSKQELESQTMAYNTQLNSLTALEREKEMIAKQIKEQTIALSRLEHEHKTTLLQYERTLSDNKSDSIQNQANDILIIKAQVDGTASVAHADVGQFVDSSQSLVSILPNDSHLIAVMYVPSRAIGFVKTDDEVLLRYVAYPYQKFGHAKGRIISVAKTAHAGQSLSTIGTVSATEQIANEPMYVIKVYLDKQTITAYGKELPLAVGMTLEGDVMHETRNLYEWVLEPLYSITGKI